MPASKHCSKQDLIVEAAQTTRVPEVLWKGAAADDVLQGISSNDTLLFSVGDGHDTLNNFETIKLDGLHASDVQLERQGDNLVLRIVATGETATAVQEFKPSWWDSEAGGKPFVAPLQRITFGDGETWNLTPDAGGQLIVGHADYNNLQGTDGNDIIFSGAGDDDITGGKGDDVLRGGDGSDYYYWQPGDGNDRIIDSGVSTSDYDVLVLENITPDHVTLSRSGNNLIVTVNGVEHITVAGQFGGTDGKGLEEIDFDNGTYLKGGSSDSC